MRCPSKWRRKCTVQSIFHFLCDHSVAQNIWGFFLRWAPQGKVDLDLDLDSERYNHTEWRLILHRHWHRQITIEPIDVCVWIGVWQCERTISRDHQCLCAKRSPRSKFDPTQQILTHAGNCPRQKNGPFAAWAKICCVRSYSLHGSNFLYGECRVIKDKHEWLKLQCVSLFEREYVRKHLGQWACHFP